MAKRQVVFYTDKELTQLKEIKKNFKGRERTQVLEDWAAKNNRTPQGAAAKMHSIKETTLRNLKVKHTRDVAVSPDRAGTIRIPVKSIVFNNGELVVNW